MAIIIKEIQVKTTVERRPDQRIITETQLQAVKRSILKEIQHLGNRHTQKRKER
ncbi:hypothetical protein EZS27_005576 [termite gut metagenome]|uniref:Uncharacterized protein n=1 Tax=termite gut metagenome TaxID=433724 RepID=A0A5J4SIG0_9ZZZZ